MTKSEAEQRRHARVPLGITLDISMLGAAATKCRATITDLSEGGMTFKTDAELEEGMTLHLKLPNKMDIRGEVRSARSGGTSGQRRYGVRFHKIGYFPTN